MNYKCFSVIYCKQGAIRRVRFNVDGLYCITSGADKTISLWNPHKGLFLKTYSGHGSDVLDACSSCDSSRILSGGKDKCMILWDVSTGKILRRVRAHESNVNCVRFNEESNIALSCSLDNTVKIWDVRLPNFSQPIQILTEAKDSVTAMQITNYEIVTSSLDCRIRRYDIRAGCYDQDFIGDPVTCISLTRDGQCYVVSTNKSVVMLFDKINGELLAEYSGHSTGDYCIENGIDKSDHYILSGSTDGRIYCWDLSQSTIVNQLEHSGNAEVHSFSVHPTENFIISASRLNINLWGEKKLTFEEDDEDEV